MQSIFGDRVTGITVQETKEFLYTWEFNNLLLCLNKARLSPPPPPALIKKQCMLINEYLENAEIFKKRSSVIPPAQHFDLSTF